MKIFDYPKRIPEIYGTFIALGLIVYFFLMYALGLIHIIELRALNVLIQVAGIYYALKQFRRTHHGEMNYFRALIIGLAASFIGTSTFVLFLFFYLKIDTGLLLSIREHAPLGAHLNTYIATFAVWVEGIFSGFMATFVLINYMETDKATQL